MVTREVDEASGFFARLGRAVVRWPLVVIGLWVALAAIPLLTLPSLATIVADQQQVPLPADAPAMVTNTEMTEAFNETGSDNVVLIVLINENGLTVADEQTYATLVERLRADTENVEALQDIISAPPVREVLQSKDNKAWNLPVTLPGMLGSPESWAALAAVTETVEDTVAGSTLTAHLTGPAATITDIAAVGQRDMRMIEIGTAVLVLLILLVVYRNPATMLLPLVMVGLCLAAAQGLIAVFATIGMAVSPETMILMTAILIGAGVDYAVFVISRYHDFVRRGAPSNEALVQALGSVGKVIAAAAATTGVTFLVMVFAKMPVFTTVGPAITISIFVAFIAAVTLLPAVIVLAGPRGWLRPRRDLTSRFWRRSGIRIARRPKSHLVASLLVLGILASFASLVSYNYDDRKTLPSEVPSALGYEAMVNHFPLDSLVPQFLYVTSPHDMRSPESLADLEQMARRVSQLPDVVAVRGITRPTGEPLEQAKATWQAGEVGSKLGEASDMIEKYDDELTLLTTGADTLADSLGMVRNQVTQAMGTVSVLVEALSTVQNQMGGATALEELDNAAELVGDMRALGEAMGVNFANFTESFNWAPPVLTALDTSPVCTVDPSCRDTREQLRRLVTARDDGTFDRISELARKLQSAEGGDSVEETVQGLRGAFAGATEALRSMGIDDPGGVQQRLATLQQGADALATGSRQLAQGVQLLVDQNRRMGAGLGQASEFLLAMRSDAEAPSMAGFYVPPAILTRDDFEQAAAAFITSDGRGARFIVQTELDPFGTEAMDQVNEITAVAQGAQPNTTLADAEVRMAGVSAVLRDTRDFYQMDLRFFMIATIAIVLLTLMVLLRAIIAPLYLVASVVLSYFSALGLGVLVFQVLLGQELHWSVSGLAFIISVAVGADYSLLLISRIRDESPNGLRIGVIRTVGLTGGVITSAGLIFAASMLGLMFASINTMIQIGFVIGVGILLDTFLVRTITVPAIAVLVGKANWWPYRWQQFSFSQAWARLRGRNDARADETAEPATSSTNTPSAEPLPS